ncbi:MAG: Ig-like domain-containing protein, partial [Gemmatimonadales bacterium]
MTFLATVSLFTRCIPTEPTSPVKIEFQLTPDSVLLAIGEQQQPAVQVTADGASIPEPRLAINTLDATTVTVDEQNRLTGKRRGRTSITVRLLSGALGDVDADATFPVRVIVGRLAMAQASDTLTALGDTLSCRPGFRDGAGNVIAGADSANLTDDLTIELSSSGNAVELLAAHGRVQALANGVDTIRATLDTSSVELEIIVEQRPASVVVSEQSFTFRSLQEPHQFSVEVFDALDNAMAGSDVSWHSTDESVVSVAGSGSSVTATSAANGSAAVVASVDGVADTVAITVQQVPRATRIISGDGQSGTVGQPLASPFVAQVTDSVGRDAPIAGVGVTFRVTTGGGSFGGAGSVEATTDDQGQASATLTLGTTAGGNEATAAVTDQLGSPVTFTATGTPAPAASMAAVSGDGQEAGAGAALPQPFVVVVQDAYGNAVPSHDVTFTVTAGGGDFDGLATVTVQTDASGQASATLTLGSTAGDPNTAEASSAGLSGSPVTFSATALVPVATVDVTPSADTLDVGEATTLTATLLDASGDTIVGRPVSWSSSDDQVAEVDGSGTVQGLAAGDVTITAQSENASGTAAVAVLGSVATIDVTPDPAEMYAEDTLRLAVSLADAAGHALERTVNWSSTDESIATVDTAGLVTGLWPGTDSIIAEAEGKADTVELTVLPIPVASVSVFPQELDLYAVNETADLTPEARDSVGELINTATFSWASRDVSVATVDQNGQVTAQNTGDTYVVVTSGSESDSAHVTVLIPTELSCDDAGGVTHDTDITASETWGRGVHRVSPQLVVDGDVVLTVEPGALICFGGGDDITFQNGARLDARGKPDSLIIWTGDPGNVWYAMRFTGSPADTSYISNALIENAADGSGAVVAQDRHAVVLDSVVVRNTRWSGVTLNAPGSRLSRSVVTSTGIDGASSGVILGDSTSLEETTVQNSSGHGVELQSVEVRLRDVRIENSGDIGLHAWNASLAEASEIRVVGSGNYGVRTDIQNVPLLIPTQEAQDSLLGNGRDSVLISGGLTNATATVRAGLPWRMENGVDISTGGVLVVEPGASIAAASEWVRLTVSDGGRIDARGTASDTVVFTMTADAGGWWEGLELTGTGSDTNYLSYALVEHGRNPDGGSWNSAAVVATDQQPIVIEHTRIRASQSSAIWLGARGSRLTDVVVDTTLTTG